MISRSMTTIRPRMIKGESQPIRAQIKRTTIKVTPAAIPDMAPAPAFHAKIRIQIAATMAIMKLIMLFVAVSSPKLSVFAPSMLCPRLGFVHLSFTQSPL